MQANFLILFFISMAYKSTGSSLSQLDLGRIINGQPVDTTSRFPHHVTIRHIQPALPNKTAPRSRSCSGSIIHNRWILTTASCASMEDKLEIQFQRLYFNSSLGSFSVIVDQGFVHYYPTYFWGYSEIDDLALIKLPVTLPTSSDLRPVLLSKEENASSVGVVPGFSKNKLSYGLFEVVFDCKSYYNANSFDAFYHMCVRGYADGYYAAVEGNEGAGLIFNKFGQPQLLGVLSKVSSGKKGSPSIFVKVQKYFPWIQYITKNEVMLL